MKPETYNLAWRNIDVFPIFQIFFQSLHMRRLFWVHR